MTSVVGVELGPEVIRAVSLDGWRRRRVRTFELYWDPANPTEAVEALRESLGSVERLAVTVDLSFLFAKQVRLPAVPAAEKRRIMMLEPERFFPIRGEDLVLAVRGEDNLVFAARSSELGKWIEALETIAPVELVEPGPVSLARALGRTTPQASTVLMEDKNEGVGIAEMEAGRVRRMRRVRRDPAELSAALASLSEANGEVYLRPLNGNPDWRPDGTPTASEPPSVPGLRPSHLSAYGATLGLGGDLGEAMLTPDLSRRIVGRRRRSVVLAAIACALAFGFAVLSLDQFRSRTLRKLEAEISRLRERGEGALALGRQADSLSRETRAVDSIEAKREDLVGALAALTRGLPSGTHLYGLRSAGRDWQIDGYAREAAPLVASLERDPRFEDVRFLAATSRVRLNGRAYESFSIAFRLVPRP